MFSQTVKPPRTYAEWVDVLDMFKSRTNDEAVLSAMQNGTIEWQSGVAERFSKQLIDAVNFRMNSASDKFQKELGRTYGQERAIVQALLSLRREMSFLSKAVNLPVIPEKDRQYYYDLIINQANNMQSSLENSAKNDRSGKLSSIIRNNKINTF